MSWTILNGQLVNAEVARISAADRGLLLGDGLFETMRADEGTVFMLEDHLARLFRSAREFNLDLPWSPAELSRMISELIAENQLEDARVRLTVTRGPHHGAMTLAPAPSPTLLITAEPLPANLDERVSQGLRLAVADVRFSVNNPIFFHKTLNRLPHLLARTQAEKNHADEAVIIDEIGNVATASTGNIFLIQDGQLFTPPLTGPLLPGITRQVVLGLARAEGIPLRENFFSPLLLNMAEEVFLTNSIQELAPVISVNNRPVESGRPGPLTRRLRELYRKETEK